MTETAAILAGALQADVETMRQLSLNVANADSVAYRRAVPVTNVSYSTIAAYVEGGGLRGAAIPNVMAATDQSTGPLRQTGNGLDIALEGAGFLVVEGPRGMELTRRGDLKLDSGGFLTDQAGARVLGEKGPIRLDQAIPEILADATVRVDGQVVDRIRVVAVPAEGRLIDVGAGRFAMEGSTGLDRPAGTLIRQGFLEGSNVQPVNEMVRVIETLRHFEATQRFVRAYDDMLQTGISELGKI